MSITNPIPRRHTFWEHGSLRCMLDYDKSPTSFAVHVFDGDRIACTEFCNDVDEAAVLAERMRQRFVEIGQRSHNRD